MGSTYNCCSANARNSKISETFLISITEIMNIKNMTYKFLFDFIGKYKNDYNYSKLIISKVIDEQYFYHSYMKVFEIQQEDIDKEDILAIEFNLVISKSTIETLTTEKLLLFELLEYILKVDINEYKLLVCLFSFMNKENKKKLDTANAIIYLMKCKEHLSKDIAGDFSDFLYDYLKFNLNKITKLYYNYLFDTRYNDYYKQCIRGFKLNDDFFNELSRVHSLLTNENAFEKYYIIIKDDINRFIESKKMRYAAKEPFMNFIILEIVSKYEFLFSFRTLREQFYKFCSDLSNG